MRGIRPRRARRFAALVALSLLVVGPSSAQVTLETVSAWDGIRFAGDFGPPRISDPPYPYGTAIGQVFSAPQEYLNNWTYLLRSSPLLPGNEGANVRFTANIGTWTGAGVGSLLWTSGLFAGTNSATAIPYVFNTGGVSLLTGGQNYIFYLAYVSGDGYLQTAVIRDDPYPGHTFQDDQRADHLGDWSRADPFDPFDLAFIAEFDRVPTETVPEPATMTLLATGLAGLAAVRRKRQRNRL
jgi:hypothetical protein